MHFKKYTIKFVSRKIFLVNNKYYNILINIILTTIMLSKSSLFKGLSSLSTLYQFNLRLPPLKMENAAVFYTITWKTFQL